MRKYSYLLTFCLCFVAGLTLKAQGVEEGAQRFVDRTGIPIPSTTYGNVEGSPYVVDTWLPGQAVTAGGKTYKMLQLKYDEVADMLIFLPEKGPDALQFAEPIKTFSLNGPNELVYLNGFPAIGKQTEKSYYQVIAAGNITLLKRNNKTVHDRKAFNTNLITQEFVDNVVYYLYKDGKITVFKKGKGALLEAMADKGSDVNKFLASNKVDFKQDQDLKKLIDYYNKL